MAAFRASLWPAASLPALELAEIERYASGPGDHIRLATCQRLERYSLAGCGCPAPERREGFDALLHLASVAAGLESLVLGEEQVVGQVRAALAVASPELRQWGALALAAARDLRRRGHFHADSGQALDRALRMTGTPAQGTLLVLGTGQMARLVARRAEALGFEVIVSGRTRPESAWFAAGGYDFWPLSELPARPAVDIVAGCLAAGAAELARGDLPAVARFALDLGTPRNFRPGAGMRVVALKDIIEDLAADAVEQERRAAFGSELRALLERRLAMARSNGASPIGRLRAAAEGVRQRELARIARLHPDIPPDTLDAITRSLVNQLMHNPTARLEQLGDPDLADQVATLFESPATDEAASGRDGAIPATLDDPVNRAILEVSEDRLQGFQPGPLGEIARLSGVEPEMVEARLRAMLEAGTIRRIRQTLMSTNLARGALVAWQVPSERLDEAFDHLFREDPFSGHVVLRSTDRESPGSDFRLWTTLKVPQGYSLARHCDLLATRIGASQYRAMPAKRLFALGVGHVRRRGLEPGTRTDEPARINIPEVTALSELEWRVLTALKREFQPEELTRDLWRPRAEEAGVDLQTFVEVATALNERGVIGRFSTFLEHVKPLADGSRVTRYNALFHWRVPAGKEVDAGCEVGRHHIITHAYWREAGPEFMDVNVMAVAHGMEKELVLAHKTAIDEHLADAGIPVEYTNVFWGGRSEIKPSEVSPVAYQEWCRQQGIDPASMREG